MNYQELGFDRTTAEQLTRFVEQLKSKFSLEMVVLFGSYATGKFIRQVSDIDILIVAHDLPDNFFERTAKLQEVSPSTLAIELLAYEPEEFAQMLEQGHPTAVDAVEFGRVLVDEERHFERHREKLRTLYKRGLRRTSVSLKLPS